MSSLTTQLEREVFIQGRGLFSTRQFLNDGVKGRLFFQQCGSVFICRSTIEKCLDSTLKKNNPKQIEEDVVMDVLCVLSYVTEPVLTPPLSASVRCYSTWTA